MSEHHAETNVTPSVSNVVGPAPTIDQLTVHVAPGLAPWKTAIRFGDALVTNVMWINLTLDLIEPWPRLDLWLIASDRLREMFEPPDWDDTYRGYFGGLECRAHFHPVDVP